eukprot:TRINITY_DN5321_c0_g1_i1.p1 TRINITY_DN5321_c0_g1~~TRINITY_DN5321_c0_g1_i1.p1  ORF type:complete len:238 (+),score=59.67 TRINITY_DN5321_c0_g1_i1:97-810(+)
MAERKALVLGGTGAVGKELVKELVTSGVFAKVRCLVRKPRGAGYYGVDDGPAAGVLEEVAVPDFDKLAEHASSYEGGFEYGFSSFGTTRKDAGGADAFRRIDKGYNITSAELMKAHGVRHFQLVSSQGASASSWLLYPKTKGEIEEAVKAMGFASVTVWRPGLLAGRPGGRAGESLANALCPNCLRIHVRTVAKAMAFKASDTAPDATVPAATVEMQDIKKYVLESGGKEALHEGSY